MSPWRVLYLVTRIGTAIGTSLHVLLRRNRVPESRLAWLFVVNALPYVGSIGYLLLGGTDIGKDRVVKLTTDFTRLPRPSELPGWPSVPHEAELSDRDEQVFTVGTSISGYLRADFNHAEPMADSDAAIERIVADIDAAAETAHVMFYIWLDDRNGTKVAEALMRAAGRGVECRAMVDGLGSRALLRGELWRRMQRAGVQTLTALPVGDPIVRVFSGRIDLRNHRKIVVIDNLITYCGSQNCADPAYLPKARYAPWVDAMMRFTGPVVRQNQHLFASDWMGNGGDDLTAVVAAPLPDYAADGSGFVAEVVATGPTFRPFAMPEMFETIIYNAKRTLFITTPYYVPDEALQSALCDAGYRGVDVTVIFPARNDDPAVGATSRSYYEGLLAAGVKIFEFLPGLLHTKSLTVDGELTLIGSANMDRRSFDLNYENNIVLRDEATTAAMRARQETYLEQSRPVTLDEVRSWSVGRRLWHNAVSVVGPLI